MATIADVAKAAGVSKGTASRVLNNRMAIAISPATVERIQRAAAELSYRPNALARALATGRTDTLGLYVESIADPHVARMLEAVEARARTLHYHLLVSSEIGTLLEQGRVDGILAVGLPCQTGLDALPQDKPVMFVYNRSAPPPENYVGWNDLEAGYQVGEHLLGLGHRRIAGLFGDEPTQGRQPDKIRGFRRAMEEGGIPWIESRGERVADPIENARLLTHELLDQRDGITAIFARNDYLAAGALEALREAGVAVPKEMSVIGYNDTPIARFSYPRLTTVRVPFAEAGELALERLVQALEGDAAPFPTILLPTTLVVRDSCAPPAAAMIHG